MRCERWNEGWLFWADRDAFAMVWNIPEYARPVTLPHDAMLEQTPYAESPNGVNTGYRDGGNYTYVKTLSVPREDGEKSYILKFEGVYSHALVYVNGQPAATEPYGYSSFYADLTPWLRAGAENEVRVLVRNAGMSNSRWYSGSGIYRDVYLLTGGPVRIEPEGVQVTTEDADGAFAVLSVRTTVTNSGFASRKLRILTEIKREGRTAAAESAPLFLRGGESRTVTRRIPVKNPALWSAENPALYTLDTLLTAEDGEILDSEADTFGVRTLALDAARGLRVNGQTVKLRGACIHHDSGLLGAATCYDAQYRQITLLKAAGFNAVRMSHHPAAPALLRACDAVGMYVMDEFSDMWTRPKCSLDYTLDFDKWWRTDVERMVKKDFNHPSVIFYSVGNEIPEIGGDAGSGICAAISELFHALDPGRYTTAGINGVFAASDRMDRILADLSRDMRENGEIDGNVNDFMTVMDTKMDQIVVHDAITQRLDMACAGLDVAGYNYMAARYEPDSAAYPNRVMVGSETYPPEIARNWALVERLPAVIGDFTWTGWDYIGEAGVGVPAYAPGEGGFGAQFPCQLAYCGDLDITGFRRPLSYYRELVFGLRKQPYIAVQDPAHFGENLIKTPWVMSDAVSAWDWPDSVGKPVIVEVYSAAEAVELFLNGKSLGRRPAGPEHGFRALFETVYAPGELRAEDACGTFVLTTPEAPALCIAKEWEGEELTYLAVRLTGPDRALTASVTGALLLGFGSGDPKPADNYTSEQTRTWHGRAQLILRKTGEAASVTVRADSGLTAQLDF